MHLFKLAIKHTPFKYFEDDTINMAWKHLIWQNSFKNWIKSLMIIKILDFKISSITLILRGEW